MIILKRVPAPLSRGEMIFGISAMFLGMFLYKTEVTPLYAESSATCILTNYTVCKNCSIWASAAPTAEAYRR